MPPEFLAADASVNWWKNRKVFILLSMQVTRASVYIYA